ncbi:hypothetical protein I316_00497 [Kwoniella heveanensis BCC8398]|uniref:Uncharacterized protein n=1 Tax=Kwoniella heveanensis BCC8398 TaxID=1296120 RepID=A0A1B9H269_9TREE|nr:hypothetical protein I316_00497 [Kwoniella heveanensis BCC8398]
MGFLEEVGLTDPNPGGDTTVDVSETDLGTPGHSLRYTRQGQTERITLFIDTPLLPSWRQGSVGSPSYDLPLRNRSMRLVDRIQGAMNTPGTTSMNPTIDTRDVEPRIDVHGGYLPRQYRTALNRFGSCHSISWQPVTNTTARSITLGYNLSPEPAPTLTPTASIDHTPGTERHDTADTQSEPPTQGPTRVGETEYATEYYVTVDMGTPRFVYGSYTTRDRNL